MTYTAPFAIWASAKSFSEGEDPVLESDGARNATIALARQHIVAGEIPGSVLICSTDLKTSNLIERWVPMGYVSERNYEPMSAKQRPKYIKARLRALTPTNGQAPEPPDIPEPLPPDPQEFVLNLDPKVAMLFRDTFTLVAQGHRVTVQLQLPETMPQQPN